MANIQVGGDFQFRPFQVKMYQLLAQYQHLWVVLPRQHGKTHFFREVLKHFLFSYQKRKNPVAFVCTQTIENTYELYYLPIVKQLEKVHDPFLIVSSGQTSRGKSRGEAQISLMRPHIGDYATIRCVGANNIDAKSGGTADFILMDEAALSPEGVYADILKPMVDDTGGKTVLSSTVRGYNWFWSTGEYYKEQMEKGSKQYGYFNKNITTAGFRTKKEIDGFLDYYKSANRMDIYYRQYLCMPGADADDLHPFLSATANIQKQVVKMNKFTREGQSDVFGHRQNEVFIACDIGKLDNYRGFAWVQGTKNNCIIGFRDDFQGSFGFVDDCYEQFAPHFDKVNLIFPFDVNHPVMKDGTPHIKEIMDYIRQKGYRNLQTYGLNKIQNKEFAIRQAVEMFPYLQFSDSMNMSFVDHLKRVEYKASKKYGGAVEGTVVRKEFNKNKYGDDHTADAFVHAVLAMRNGVAALKNFTRVWGIYRAMGGPRTYEVKKAF